MVVRCKGIADRILTAGLVAGMSGKRLIERIQQNEDDQPEDDLGGDAHLLGYFFVEVFVLHGAAPHGEMQMELCPSLAITSMDSIVNMRPRIRL
jgi:hypothetical protein